MQVQSPLRARLIQLLTEALPKIGIEKGLFIRAQDALTELEAGEKALDGKLRQSLSQFISENPFGDFVLGYLNDEVSRVSKYNDLPHQPLLQLTGFEDPKAAATRIVNEFASLPWDYTFVYPLSLKASSPPDQQYSMGSSWSLVCPGANFSKTYPAAADHTLAGLMLARNLTHFRQPSPWSQDRLYLVHKETGYLTGLFLTQLAKNIQLSIRVFGGLLEATGHAHAAEDSNEWRAARFAQNYGIYSYVQRSGGYELGPSVELDDEHGERLASFQWAELPTADITWELWIDTIAKRFTPAMAQTDAASLLRRCCQWHFDSSCGTNRLLQFVQATVAIEILLGDKSSSDLIGLGELLANRCAYSLARNADERQGLLKEFKRIYDTRSKIVHRGKADLTGEEMSQLWRLRSLGGRLIRNELKLMQPENSPWGKAV